jgi:hypothetical protein
MRLLAAIVALVVVQLLYLAFSLPREFINPNSGMDNESKSYRMIEKI